jgi:hypothetical protein
LCTHRSVSGKELKSSSSAIPKQFAVSLSGNAGVGRLAAGVVASFVDSADGPKCVTLLISFWTEYPRARILNGRVDEKTLEP